MSSQSDGLGRT